MIVTEENTPDTLAPATENPPALSPAESRFLFVDMAAQRAKQLRRGALPRLQPPGQGDGSREVPRKPERVAMEEVRQGLISYELPELKPPQAEADR
jgi:DNA-directed RNA polymerase subunit K/omega